MLERRQEKRSIGKCFLDKDSIFFVGIILSPLNKMSGADDCN